MCRQPRCFRGAARANPTDLLRSAWRRPQRRRRLSRAGRAATAVPARRRRIQPVAAVANPSDDVRVRTAYAPDPASLTRDVRCGRAAVASLRATDDGAVFHGLFHSSGRAPGARWRRSSMRFGTRATSAAAPHPQHAASIDSKAVFAGSTYSRTLADAGMDLLDLFREPSAERAGRCFAASRRV